MNRIHRLTETLTISDQLQPADVAALAAQGVKTIICNRPDNEEFGQPASAALRSLASEHGMAFIEQPVSFSTLRASDGEAFARHMSQAATGGAVHAFCRSGRRCVALWAMANAKALGTHGVLERAASVGEDLRGLAPMLSEIEARP
jgi:sulfide:quinone oxidoreductase